MIAPETVQEIRRLLAKGNLSQRKIARIVRVSRATVGAIATGKRRDRRQPRKAREAEQPLRPAGPPQRCPGCGGLVYLPCRRCEIRRVSAGSSKRKVLPRPMQLDEPLGLELTEEHRRRYQQVRARRQAAERRALQPIWEEDELEEEHWEPHFEEGDFYDDADFGAPSFWDDLQLTVR